ncbi:MAG TPA: protein-disulfide reductase DsbD N-terminal domain-containing protein, partial [Pirellulales bacterium]
MQWTLGGGKAAPGAKAYLELKATIQPGWHLYSPTTPPGGPIITKIDVAESPAIASYTVYRPQPVRKLDPNFQIDTETYTGTANFLLELATSKSASGNANVVATVRYQVCSDTQCLPPVKKSESAAL